VDGEQAMSTGPQPRVIMSLGELYREFDQSRQAELVAPHSVRLCDWCWDLHFRSRPDPMAGPCNHPECQCWCVTNEKGGR